MSARRDAEIILDSTLAKGRQTKIHVRALDSKRIEILRAWRRNDPGDRWKSAPDLPGVEHLASVARSLDAETLVRLATIGEKREKARP